MSGRSLKLLGGAYFLFSMAFVVAAVIAHFLGQAVLGSIVSMLAAIVLLGVS
jgi:hypothetical protein